MSAKNTDEFMELMAAILEKHDDDLPFWDHNHLLSTIDKIEVGKVPWESSKARYNGEIPSNGPVPEWMESHYEVFYRDPRLVVYSLLANPDFDGEFDYSPYQEFENEERRWSNFMSGNWAWKQAVRLSSFLLQTFTYTLFYSLRYYWPGRVNPQLNVCADHSWE
jgi:Plavaka transposase